MSDVTSDAPVVSSGSCGTGKVKRVVLLLFANGLSGLLLLLWPFILVGSVMGVARHGDVPFWEMALYIIWILYPMLLILIVWLTWRQIKKENHGIALIIGFAFPLSMMLITVFALIYESF